MPTVETHTTKHQRNLDRDRHLDRALISVEISIGRAFPIQGRKRSADPPLPFS